MNFFVGSRTNVSLLLCLSIVFIDLFIVITDCLILTLVGAMILSVTLEGVTVC